MEPTPPMAVMTMEKKIYSGTAARCIKLQGSGCTQAEAARALGITEGQVSQWNAEPDFVFQINQLVKKTFAEQSKIDENYNSIELQLSDRLTKAVEHVYDADKILRILKFTNEAKRRIASPLNPEGEGSGLKPVALILPVFVAQEFMLSPNNEVIGINGRELTTLPSKDIGALAKAKREATDVKITELKKLKPNGSGHQDPWGNL